MTREAQSRYAGFWMKRNAQKEEETEDKTKEETEKNRADETKEKTEETDEEKRKDFC